MNEKEFTISIFTENRVGILNHITIVLTRRQLNIESVTTSESAVEGVQLINLVVKTTYEKVRKVAKQIEKIIEVIKVFVNSSNDVISREIALFKLSAKVILSNDVVDLIMKTHNAKFIEINSEFMVVEKVGSVDEIKKLFCALKPFGILQFARSGRVAVTRQVKEFQDYLSEVDSAFNCKEYKNATVELL
ncbi:acetolactate synthase small subunit [Tenuifilum thalassicum]|uniref:Acetolactate synthase small subunit n=1 Tax=Tenuifilum thalassicum TaxID=2590900 RepID=A0A7D3XYQ8_9BACT|nr:acetolactate synthase small subunit [Tenuifilum thalassicum]QKG79373.1 acetolactate synthase small subunit [Tenuifilum thalassicum]